MGSEEAEGLEGGEWAEGRWEGGGGGGSSFNFLRGTSVLTSRSNRSEGNRSIGY